MNTFLLGGGEREEGRGEKRRDMDGYVIVKK